MGDGRFSSLSDHVDSLQRSLYANQTHRRRGEKDLRIGPILQKRGLSLARKGSHFLKEGLIRKRDRPLEWLGERGGPSRLSPFCGSSALHFLKEFIPEEKRKGDRLVVPRDEGLDKANRGKNCRRFSVIVRLRKGDARAFRRREGAPPFWRKKKKAGPCIL